MGKKSKSGQAGSSRRVRTNKFLFLGLFLPVAALVLVIGNLIASARMDAHIDKILEYDGTRLHLISGFLGAEILGSLKHLRSLATEADTRGALDTPKPAQLLSLESSFLILAQRNPLYQQVRWIDEAGRERARVTRDQDKIAVTAQQDLQDKSDRYYFKQANALLPGELYISRIDLNEERGQVELPLLPVVRIATPVSDNEQRRRGIIIINIEMKYLFEFVSTTDQADLEVEYLLVNQDGTLLSADFGSIMPEDAPDTAVDIPAAPPDVWAHMSVNSTGSLETADGLWTWRKLTPVTTFKRMTRNSPQHLIAFDQMISDDFTLSLLAHRPVETLEAMRRENLELITLGAVFVLSIYGLVLAFYLSGAARARRAEVDAAREKERANDLKRMKELEERFRHLVEASSIGLLSVDSTGRIEITNGAVDLMLGYERGELDGAQVETLLPDSIRDKHVGLREQFMREPEARRMGFGRELKAVRKDKTTFPVEVALNPYTDDGRPLVLVSIIDLSHRQE
jgi:PAS domain S-box-containing protein